MKKEELKELSMSNIDKVKRALHQGDIEEAEKCVEVMENESRRALEKILDMAYTFLTYIGRTYGEEEVLKALRFRHETLEVDQRTMWGMTNLEDAVRHKALIHRGVHSKMTFTEEKDRFVLKLDPCNSGGRMLRKGLHRPPTNLGTFQKAYPETWNKTGISYYCAHCAQNSVISVEKGCSYPYWICERSLNPEDPCYQILYKRTEDAPKKYFEELGLKK